MVVLTPYSSRSHFYLILVLAGGSTCTWLFVVAGPVHAANEELQANDGIDDDDEEDQQGDVEQGNHGFDYGVQHYL